MQSIGQAQCSPVLAECLQQSVGDWSFGQCVLWKEKTRYYPRLLFPSGDIFASRTNNFLFFQGTLTLGQQPSPSRLEAYRFVGPCGRATEICRPPGAPRKNREALRLEGRGDLMGDLRHWVCS